MAKTYGFGIIGTGFIGEYHAEAIKALPNAKLVAACERVEANAKRFCQKMHGCKIYRDFNEMLKDPAIDVVTIATPSGSHMEPAVAAAQAGKHAIVEKPIEITASIASSRPTTRPAPRSAASSTAGSQRPPACSRARSSKAVSAG
jgi:predicted dehydrogenase